MATEERALRAELDALARKKEQIQAKRRTSGNRGNGDRPAANGDSQYSRANNGAGNASAAQRRGSGGSTGSGDRRVEGGRAGKRPNDQNADTKKADDDTSGKRQRLSSGDAKDSPRAGGEARKADAPKENTANEREKRRAVATYAEKDGLARSRRMFGALMGHLGKAKAMIEKDSTLLKKQTSKQHEAEQKEKEQSKALEIKAKRDATVSRLENLIATAEIEMQELLARTKLQHLQQARKGASLSRFLLTVASPPIYYLPKKHTKETEDLVAASVEVHEEKMVLSNREHQTKLREIEAEYVAKIEKYKLELEEATRELGGDEEKKEAKDNEEAAPANEETEHAESKEESMESAKNEEAQDHEEETHVASPAPASPKQTSETPPRREQPASPERAVSRKRSAVADEADEADESSKRAKRESIEEEVVDVVEKPTTPEAVEESRPVDSPPPPQPSTAEESPAADTTPKVVEATEEPSPATAQKQKMDVSKLRVTDLREELKKRGLDTKGNKPVLVQRLEEALNQEV